MLQSTENKRQDQKLKSLISDMVNLSRSSRSNEEHQAFVKDLMRSLKSNVKAADSREKVPRINTLPDNVTRMIGNRLLLANKAHLAMSSKDSQRIFQPQLNDAKGIWKAIDGNIRTLMASTQHNKKRKSEYSVLNIYLCMPLNTYFPSSVMSNIRSQYIRQDKSFGLLLEMTLDNNYTSTIKEGKRVPIISKWMNVTLSVFDETEILFKGFRARFKSATIDKQTLNPKIESHVPKTIFETKLNLRPESSHNFEESDYSRFLTTLKKSCEFIAYTAKETGRPISVTYTSLLPELCGLLTNYLKTNAIGSKNVNVIAKETPDRDYTIDWITSGFPPGTIAIDFSKPAYHDEEINTIRRMELTIDKDKEKKVLKLFKDGSEPAHVFFDLEAINTTVDLLKMKYSGDYPRGKLDFNGTGPLAIWMYCKLTHENETILSHRLA